MDEAERNAHRIAVIDKGKIIETGSPDDLMSRTDTDNVEDAFLELTGREIRETSAEPGAGVKKRRKMKSS